MQPIYAYIVIFVSYHFSVPELLVANLVYGGENVIGLEADLYIFSIHKSAVGLDAGDLNML